MTTTLPATAPTFDELPSGTKQGTAIGGRTHRQIHNDVADSLETLIAMQGVGATNPYPNAAHKTKKATADGVVSWGYHSYVKLGEVAASGSSAVMEISSIPATFQHLVLCVVGKSTTAGVGASACRLTFESSPTSGAYNHQMLLANNTTVSAIQNVGSFDWIDVGLMPTDGAHANLFGSSWVAIMEYANTGVYKNVFSLNCGHNDISSGGFHQRNVSGLWESTAAIDRVRITASTGNWKAGSKLSLFGVPAAA